MQAVCVALFASLALALWLVLSATPALGGSQTVNLSIMKVDEDGNRIADVTFTLDGGDELATDAAGAVVFAKISLNSLDLELMETGNPDDECNDAEDDVLGSLFVSVDEFGTISVGDLDTEDELTAEFLDIEGITTLVVTNTCGDDSDGSGPITEDVTIDLNILKQDQDGEPLADVEFGLVFTDVGATVITTGDDGTFALSDITLDAIGEVDLTLTETVNANEGCEEDVLGSLDIDVISATEVEVTDTDTDDALTAEVVDGTTIVITNDCADEVPVSDGGDLEIIKTDDEGNLLGDVEFNLSGDGDSTIDLDEITNDDGIAIFEDLELDSSFTLTETSGSDECEQDEETSLTIDVSIDGVISLTDEDDEDSLDVDLDADLDLDLGLLDDEDGSIVLVNECDETDSGTGAAGGGMVPDTATDAPAGPAAPLTALIGTLAIVASAGTALRTARRA